VQKPRRSTGLRARLSAIRTAARHTVASLRPFPHLSPMPADTQHDSGARRDAIIFSSYVPTPEALTVATEFLRLFEERFADCDVYVGINTGSLPEWERLLRDSPLRIRIGSVGPRLTVDSDAAGFQRALELMRDEGTEYDLVWFGHTKGATSNDPVLRKRLIGDFYLKRERITQLFRHPRVGAFGHDISVSTGLAPIDELLDGIFVFPYPSIGTFYLHTFYVLRGSIVREFLGGVDDDFFTKNLVTDLGFDRYFFERDFARIAERLGFHPLYRQRHRHETGIAPTRRVVRGLYDAWEQRLPAALRSRAHLR